MNNVSKLALLAAVAFVFSGDQASAWWKKKDADKAAETKVEAAPAADAAKAPEAAKDAAPAADAAKAPEAAPAADAAKAPEAEAKK